jgi:hypothetical protein
MSLFFNATMEEIMNKTAALLAALAAGAGAGAGYTVANNTESGTGSTGYDLGIRHTS